LYNILDSIQDGGFALNMEGVGMDILIKDITGKFYCASCYVYKATLSSGKLSHSQGQSSIQMNKSGLFMEE
jgi:hypothetical protein